MLTFYKFLTQLSRPALSFVLNRRLKKEKEDSQRLNERKGFTEKLRPDGKLVWIHAASVGEAQSTLILINRLLKQNNDAHVLVTTGTLTSAKLMQDKLPARAFHQFYPLDHPLWVAQFLNYWAPDLVLWMESELWPNMLLQIKQRDIPAALVNARLSDKSFKRWSLFKRSAQRLLGTFTCILTQTDKDAVRFTQLGAQNVTTTDNLKFSAAPLETSPEDVMALEQHLKNRPTWVFASTHKGEEEMACRIHDILKNNLPDILTIIVPRHPERRQEIQQSCSGFNLMLQLRGEQKTPPSVDTDIYVADTLGELGLFYNVAPVACIGRSFSDDGGGGHNPIEAAQLNCAVLYGPNVQYQQEIYDEMNEARAALRMPDEHRMADTLHTLLTDLERLATQQKIGLDYAQHKSNVIERVMEKLSPVLSKADLS